MVVGIAGGYCAGKDTVSRLLAERGFDIIDVDRIGHQVLEEQADAVRDAFGPEILDSGGGVDRRALGRVVFASRGHRRTLEAILHPRMVERLERQIERAADNTGINAALLFPMGLHRLCHAAFWVHAPLAVRIIRAVRRDRLPLCAVIGRMRSQAGIGPQHHGSDVDIYPVRNTGNSERLEQRINACLLEMGAR